MHVRKYKVNPIRKEIRYDFKLLREKAKRTKKSNLDKHKKNYNEFKCIKYPH